jgi:excisionase family DNA binding protein
MSDVTDLPKIMTAGEVGDLLGITAGAVAKQARTGRLPCFRTAGGHRRFWRADVLGLLAKEKAEEREVMLPTEVARLFRVHQKTATSWAKSGKLPFFRTPSGRIRFYRDQVMAVYGVRDSHAPGDEFFMEDEPLEHVRASYGTGTSAITAPPSVRPDR